MTRDSEPDESKDRWYYICICMFPKVRIHFGHQLFDVENTQKFPNRTEQNTDTDRRACGSRLTAHGTRLALTLRHRPQAPDIGRHVGAARRVQPHHTDFARQDRTGHACDTRAYVHVCNTLYTRGILLTGSPRVLRVSANIAWDMGYDTVRYGTIRHDTIRYTPHKIGVSRNTDTDSDRDRDMNTAGSRKGISDTARGTGTTAQGHGRQEHRSTGAHDTHAKAKSMGV